MTVAMTNVYQVGFEPDPAKKLRYEWAESLAEHLAEHRDPETGERGMSRKQFQARLAMAGLEVSQQTISLWLHGKTSPRPVSQGVIAGVFGVPVRRLFPIEAA